MNEARATMSESFAIRRWSDACSFDELHALLHRVFGALDIDPPSGMLRETVNDLRRRARTQTIFVATAVGALIGHVCCEQRPDALYIGRLAVDAGWRRRGVARALMDAARGEAMARGCPQLRLGCRIALADNVAFFRRLGFAIVGESTHPGYTAPTSFDMTRPTDDRPL
jgi:ribosomal protein S18 acetylase RimI-like enzyme